MKRIETTVEKLDDVRELFERFTHFTVRDGKAIYHMIHVPEKSVGIYYAVRCADDSPHIEAKRALEPLTKIVCWGE